MICSIIFWSEFSCYSNMKKDLISSCSPKRLSQGSGEHKAAAEHLKSMYRRVHIANKCNSFYLIQAKEQC